MVGMKRILMILLLVVACRQIEPLIEPGPAVGPEFSAEIEAFGSDTKTALAYGNSVVWSAGDQLAIFQGKSVADKYQVKSDWVGTTSGTFEIVANGTGTPAATFETNIAVYPYEENLDCTPITENGAVVSYQITGVTVPSVQTYVPDSFPDDAFLMVAMTDGLDNHTLNFKNLCGALKPQLKGKSKVKSIELKGNDNEPLSGNATVTIYPEGTTPAIAMSGDASATVKLDCGEGVQLDETTAIPFIVAVPPTSFENGFTAVVEMTDGGKAEITTSKANPVKRSYLHTMPEKFIGIGYDVDPSYGLITQLTDGMQYHPGEVSGPKGILNANSSYNSWSYTVPNDCEIFAGEEKSKYGYFSISVVPAGATSGVRYRFYSTEDTLPTIDNPLEVTAGSTVYVSVRKDIVNWAYYTTDVISTSAGISIMDALSSNKLILRNTYITDELQNLLILKKCENSDELFLGQNFIKVVDRDRNSNCWRLGTLDLYKRIGNEFVVYKSGIIISGEWECAIKESGAEDFLGGNAHGDEQLIEISASLDGRPLDLSSSFVATGYSLDIDRRSLLNRCNTPGDNVIDHSVTYNITPEAITINQTAEWLQDMVVETSYLLMCPISRAYTTSARIDGQSEIVDISNSGHSRPSISGNKGQFELWGDNFSAKIEYECLEGAFAKAFSFISPSSSPAYNKFYYNFVGSNAQEPVKAGHKVTTYGKISYSYSE